MNKLLVRSFLVLAAFAVLTIPAKAQAVDQLVVKIPFQFVAAGQTFPAGEYKISRLRDEQPRILILTSLENRADNVMLRPETQDSSLGQAKLAFTTVGDQHVLSRIQTDSYAYTIALPRADALMAAAARKGAAASSASGSN
jgi:hypothetical protein